MRNTPFRKIAERYGPSSTALFRHKRHLPAKLVQAHRAEEVTEATSLLSRVEQLVRESERIAEAANSEKNWPAATAALREARSCLELLGRLRGELHSGNSMRIGVSVTTNVPRVEGEGTLVDVETRIAEHVAAATDNFNPREIERLRLLLERANTRNDAGPEDSLSRVPSQDVCFHAACEGVAQIPPK